MPTSRGGRTLEECHDYLGALAKRKGRGEQLSSAKRRRIFEEKRSMVLATNNKNISDDSSTRSKEEVTKPDAISVDAIKHIQEQLELARQDNEKVVEQRKRAFFKKQSDLIGVYMYGLEKISKLTDVRDAPDAILPGNQV